MWDEAAHSEPTEEEKSRKKYFKCHLCSVNLKKHVAKAYYYKAF